MVLVSINPIDLSEENSFSYYEKIASSKKNERKELLYGKSYKNKLIEPSRIYHKTKEKYDFYDKNINKLESLVPDSYNNDEKNALQHCYTSPTDSLNKLKDKIIKSQKRFYQTKCAYCGINTWSDMDHYVPKEQFPEYSVHPLNLIPICSICNRKKANIFIEDNKRIFFNPYSDEINKTVLSLEIEYDKTNESFLFNIYVDENFRFKYHIEKLGIISRYKEEAINVFDDVIFDVTNSFDSFFEETSDLIYFEKTIRHYLENKKMKILEIQGMNSLDFLVYNSFLESKYFDIEFLIENFGSSSSKLKLASIK